MTEASGPTSAGLLAVAEAINHPISGATLSHWRRRGLLPKVRRARGGRSVFVHPVGTDQQLRQLLYWRERSDRLAYCAVALWVEGFPIQASVVRGAVLESAAVWQEGVEEALGAGSAADQTIDALAGEMARKRSNAPIPHLSRMRLVDRERAYGYLFAVMFGLDEQMNARSGDLKHLERLLGLRRGHGGGIADEFSLKEADGFGTRLRKPAARSIIIRATNVELEFARRLIGMTVEWLPRLAEALFADQAVKSLDLAALAQNWLADPPAEVMALMAVDILVTLDERQPTVADLRTAVGSLSPSAVTEEFNSMLAELGAGPG
jgi:hypothetical protein